MSYVVRFRRFDFHLIVSRSTPDYDHDSVVSKNQFLEYCNATLSNYRRGTKQYFYAIHAFT